MSGGHPLLEKYAGLSDEALAALPLDQLLKDTSELTGLWENRKRENGILFYEPAHDKARQFHLSHKRESLLSGGNRSSKTCTALAEIIIQATKIIPYSLQEVYPKEKLIKGPIRARIVVESFVENWEKVIKPKLQWWRWNGPGEPGSARGHWGLIPRSCLLAGDWDKAFSEKYRTLSLADGGMMTINSYDQEVAKLAGGSYHVTLFDELPPKSHYTECKMRLLDTGGQLMVAMTPPTEASGIAAGWVYDELMEPGLGGHPDIAAFEFHTEENRVIGAEELRWISAGLTEEERQVRLYGKFLHLSGLIHPLFTGKSTRQWCLHCDRPVVAVNQGRCPGCNREELQPFSHVVKQDDWPRRWPVVMVIDPHPRKPCAITWTAVDEEDQWTQVEELEATGTAQEVAEAIAHLEETRDIRPVLRLIDPNAAESRNDKVEMGWTLRREFDKAGLRCTLANDAFDVGRSRVNEALRPDPLTQRPRWQVMEHCEKTIYALSRFTWDEWSRNHEFKDPKQTPREKHKDFPDTLRYLAMFSPTFRMLHIGYEAIRYREGQR